MQIQKFRLARPFVALLPLLAAGCSALAGENSNKAGAELLGDTAPDVTGSSRSSSTERATKESSNAGVVGPAAADASQCDSLMNAPSTEHSGAASDTNALQLQREEVFDDERYVQIWGHADDDIWAIGERNAPSHASAARAALDCDATRFDASVLARHFDGDEWTLVDFPSNTRVNEVRGSGSDDIWAVGAHAQAWHFDGHEWTSHDLSDAIGGDAPTDPCSEVVFSSVWVQSKQSAWIVGFAYLDGDQSPLILHYDGAAWTRQAVQGDEPLLSVWAADAQHAWAVGASGVMHTLQGEQWQRAPKITDRDLNVITGVAADNVWVAGSSATMLRFDGSDWKPSDPAVDYMVSEGMVARAGAGVWMLSDSIHQQGIAIDYVQTVDHWDGEQWCSVRTSNDTTRMLSELWVSPSGQVWGAGYALVRVL